MKSCRGEMRVAWASMEERAVVRLTACNGWSEGGERERDDSEVYEMSGWRAAAADN